MKALHALAILAALTLVPAPAQAQQEFLKENAAKFIQRVGIHAGVSLRQPLDNDVVKGVGAGVSVGLGSGGGTGWKFPIGFTSFSEYLVGPDRQRFAHLKSRSIYAGIGYGWTFGRFSTGIALQAGYAFNHARFDGAIAERSFVSEGPVSLDVGNSWMVRPRLKLEYFLAPKLSLRSTADYVFTRPTITLMTPNGPISNRWDASNFHASFGIGIYPFRKGG